MPLFFLSSATMMKRDPPPKNENWTLCYYGGTPYLVTSVSICWLSLNGFPKKENRTVSQVRALGRARFHEEDPKIFFCGIWVEKLISATLFAHISVHHVLHVSVTLWFHLHLKDHFTLFLSSVICLSPSSLPFRMKQSVHPLSSRGQGCINTSFFTPVLPISILSFSIDISSILSMSVPKNSVITLSLTWCQCWSQMWCLAGKSADLRTTWEANEDTNDCICFKKLNN